MSEIKKRQFQVKGGKATPFIPNRISNNRSLVGTERVSQDSSKRKPQEVPNGPYGSLWGLQHLNWLHIHFALGYDWTDLFTPGSELSQSSQIVVDLHRRLGADWKWICHTTHHDSLSIYAYFRRLIYQRKEDDDWKTSTYASTDPNSPSSPKGQSPRNSTSPPQHRQITTSHQGT